VTEGQKTIAGLAAAAVAIILLAVHFAGKNGSPTGTCAISTAAFEGDEYAKIAAAAGVGTACEVAIKQWAENPDDSVKIRLQVGSSSTSGSVTGTQVSDLGEQQPPETRFEYCLDRYNLFSNSGKACLSGQIN
jgi:hypothetical protein